MSGTPHLERFESPVVAADRSYPFLQRAKTHENYRTRYFRRCFPLMNYSTSNDGQKEKRSDTCFQLFFSPTPKKKHPLSLFSIRFTSFHHPFHEKNICPLCPPFQHPFSPAPGLQARWPRILAACWRCPFHREGGLGLG